MRTGLRGLLALLWLLLTLPAVVLNGLLLLNAQTARGLCFAGLAFLVLALPLLWLSQRSLFHKTLASIFVIALVVLVAVDGLVGLRVSGATETEGLDIVEHGEAVA